MIIIVDAYNVLKQLKPDFIERNERQAFINKLKKYSRAKKHKMIIVFDGGECTWPMIENDQHMSIVYSGSQISADDYIRRYMKEHAHASLLLVTNDNELRKSAHRYEVDTLDSMEFYAKINPSRNKVHKKANTSLIKYAQDTLQEVDDLMQQVSDVPIKQDDTEQDSRRSSGFTASKKERKINKKLKKL